MRNKCFNSSNKNACEFHDLPDHVKLMIFSNLSCKTLGVALCVCKDWNLLIRNPSVWTNVDFTDFNFCLKSHNNQHRECSMLCYYDYANRMKTFMNLLISIKPIVKSDKFCYDIYFTFASYEWLSGSNVMVSILLHIYWYCCSKFFVVDIDWFKICFLNYIWRCSLKDVIIVFISCIVWIIFILVMQQTLINQIKNNFQTFEIFIRHRGSRRRVERTSAGLVEVVSPEGSQERRH